VVRTVKLFDRPTQDVLHLLRFTWKKKLKTCNKKRQRR